MVEVDAFGWSELRFDLLSFGQPRDLHSLFEVFIVEIQFGVDAFHLSIAAFVNLLYSVWSQYKLTELSKLISEKKLYFI